MSPPAKKIKIHQKVPSKANVIDELRTYQEKIREIKGGTALINTGDPVKDEHDYNDSFREDPTIKHQNCKQYEDDMKQYLREQIRLSERRILHKLDQLDRKINRLLCRPVQMTTTPEEEMVEEEHLTEWDDEFYDHPVDETDLDNRLFPIADEKTFDWFCDKLHEEEYRNALIQQRWHMTRNLSTKSVNVAVKDFLRMHFDLTVCVKYSVSGFGAHGVRKKKLDFKSLRIYVYECFKRSSSEFYSMQDVSKAIVQFWGRAPDTLNKANERAIKREYVETM